MNDIINFDEIIKSWNWYFIEYAIHQLKAIKVLKQTDFIKNAGITAIIDYTGERETETCNTYTDMIDTVIKHLGIDYDCGSSSGSHAYKRFISETILKIWKQRTEERKRAVKAKIKKLEAELAALKESDK